MKLRAVFAFVAVLGASSMLAATACQDDAVSPGRNNTEECCPVSEAPSCSSFLLGGARSLQAGGVCPAALSDNIPTRHEKKVDAKGCSYWELDHSSPRTCGVVNAPDAANDADTASDAGSDADAGIVSDADTDAGADADTDAGADAGDVDASDIDAGDGDAGDTDAAT